MTGAISEDADFMEKIGDLGGEQSLEPQATEQVGLGFLAWLKESRLRSDELRKQLQTVAA
jgi:hypothetical protein